MEQRAAHGDRQIATSPDHQIDVVYPLRWERGRPVPFPTIYWLKPGELHRAVANLERQGLIAELEERIQNDASFRDAVHDDHRRYIAQRWAMLTEDDRTAVEEFGLREHFHERGIAGIADFNHVKCLHAHVAHALADRNLIGQHIQAQVDRLTK